jgi:hypothetical protein
MGGSAWAAPCFRYPLPNLADCFLKKWAKVIRSANIKME